MTILWSAIGFLLFLIILVWRVVRRVPPLENISFNGKTATELEVKTEILGELSAQFRSRFPGREFELNYEEMELNVPNENEEIYGLKLHVTDPDEIELITGHDIHWHLIREYCHTNTGEEVYPAVVLLIERVLDLVDQIFCNKICFYSEEGGRGRSGRYEIGARPVELKESRKRMKEWSWSGWLHI